MAAGLQLDFEGSGLGFTYSEEEHVLTGTWTIHSASYSSRHTVMLVPTRL